MSMKLMVIKLNARERPELLTRFIFNFGVVLTFSSAEFRRQQNSARFALEILIYFDLYRFMIFISFPKMSGVTRGFLNSSSIFIMKCLMDSQSFSFRDISLDICHLWLG